MNYIADIVELLLFILMKYEQPMVIGVEPADCAGRSIKRAKNKLELPRKYRTVANMSLLFR